ncbi:hypothetical protein DMC30DRAFT_215530 [Rhodotorula diobovata]|uniref:Uncharacterized protein n=1 Tax=Rhodotorula diobovata TaxID=5288 RepID=A0A5C5G4Y9_9BASI|nr:hypothetical protein DMC30DRAFT_215530 [Rhodotorula diobovata]
MCWQGSRAARDALEQTEHESPAVDGARSARPAGPPSEATEALAGITAPPSPGLQVTWTAVDPCASVKRHLGGMRAQGGGRVDRALAHAAKPNFGWSEAGRAPSGPGTPRSGSDQRASCGSRLSVSRVAGCSTPAPQLTAGFFACGGWADGCKAAAGREPPRAVQETRGSGRPATRSSPPYDLVGECRLSACAPAQRGPPSSPWPPRVSRRRPRRVSRAAGAPTAGATRAARRAMPTPSARPPFCPSLARSRAGPGPESVGWGRSRRLESAPAGPRCESGRASSGRQRVDAVLAAKPPSRPKGDEEERRGAAGGTVSRSLPLLARSRRNGHIQTRCYFEHVHVVNLTNSSTARLRPRLSTRANSPAACDRGGGDKVVKRLVDVCTASHCLFAHAAHAQGLP